ncbi:MAG: 2-oxo-4-hydroxy-4-carboxy-5-ureidoimidazoline decarboxylase [Candidatus Dormibacteraceae bacterium]
MSIDGLVRFNGVPPDEAERQLHACFASARWARLVAGRRPYADLRALLEDAERAWADLEPPDWAEALRGHPRVGERGGSSPAASELEQSGVRGAGAGVLEELAEENRRYEARFGHVFLIAAAGKGPDEILAALRRRMGNDQVTEAQVTAAEHRKIARMRLERMMGE